MRTVGVAVGGVSALLVLTSALIAGLLIYYRPTVEYAHVSIIDNHEGPSHPFPGWAPAAVSLAAALIIWFGYRGWRRHVRA